MSASNLIINRITRNFSNEEKTKIPDFITTVYLTTLTSVDGQSHL